MGKMMKHRFPRNDVYWAIWVQCILIFIFFLIAWASLGEKTAKSFLMGSLVCVLPNVYLYLRVFTYFGARSAHKIIGAFYWGEAVKWFLTGIGFLIALSLQDISKLVLFVGYLFGHVAFLVMPIIVAYTESRRRTFTFV